MQDSLNLLPSELDDANIIRDVERIFGITITNDEARAIDSVGQLYDLILAKCGSDRAQACFTQIAFYRLRRALRALGTDTAITPDTSVSIVRQLDGGSIAQNWKALACRSGLVLPRRETPILPTLGPVALVCIAVGALVLARQFGLGTGVSLLVAFVAPVVFGAVLIALDIVLGDIPRRIATIGDLAREAAGHSYSELLRARAAPSAVDKWYALTAILRKISGYQHRITRDTTFFSR